MTASAWAKKYAPGKLAAGFSSAVPGERAVAVWRSKPIEERSTRKTAERN
jgi:hypothetical protein